MSNKKSNEVKLHPLSYQALKKGHFWVTADAFSQRFPPHKKLLAAGNFLLLNDPSHPHIKARLWCKSPHPHKEIPHFWKQVATRLQSAIQKRMELRLFEQRDNIYLCFGEADLLPGLFIQKIGKAILIQIYSYFWEDNFDRLKTVLKAQFKEFQLFPYQLFKQIRDQKEQKIIPLQHDCQKQFTITELGLNYKIDFESGADFGIYTDMASIRAQMAPWFKEAKSTLNLYAYTGAFSLHALQYGTVTSVDLSGRYLDWLEQNIELNRAAMKGTHQRLQLSVGEALKQLEQQRESFDFIICDPPSFSNDGKKNSNAMESYKKQIPQLLNLLKPRGKALLCLNTHKIAPGKFYQTISDILQKHQAQIIAKFTLSQDCPTLAYFKEGNYLKAVLITNDPQKD